MLVRIQYRFRDDSGGLSAQGHTSRGAPPQQVPPLPPWLCAALKGHPPLREGCTSGYSFGVCLAIPTSSFRGLFLERSGVPTKRHLHFQEQVSDSSESYQAAPSRKPLPRATSRSNSVAGGQTSGRQVPLPPSPAQCPGHLHPLHPSGPPQLGFQHL